MVRRSRTRAVNEVICIRVPSRMGWWSDEAGAGQVRKTRTWPRTWLPAWCGGSVRLRVRAPGCGPTLPPSRATAAAGKMPFSSLSMWRRSRFSSDSTLAWSPPAMRARWASISAVLGAQRVDVGCELLVEAQLGEQAPLLPRGVRVQQCRELRDGCRGASTVTGGGGSAKRAGGVDDRHVAQVDSRPITVMARHPQ